MRTAATLRIELPVGEVGPQHEQDIAIEHGVVARREADQSGHANIVGVVPLDMFLAAQRMHHRRFQPLAKREKQIMGTLTSRSA